MREQGFDTPTARAPATSKWLNMRLDAVYTRGLSPLTYSVERKVHLSDHYPMWIELTWAGAAKDAAL